MSRRTDRATDLLALPAESASEDAGLDPQRAMAAAVGCAGRVRSSA